MTCFFKDAAKRALHWEKSEISLTKSAESSLLASTISAHFFCFFCSTSAKDEKVNVRVMTPIATKSSTRVVPRFARIELCISSPPCKMEIRNLFLAWLAHRKIRGWAYNRLEFPSRFFH